MENFLHTGHCSINGQDRMQAQAQLGLKLRGLGREIGAGGVDPDRLALLVVEQRLQHAHVGGTKASRTGLRRQQLDL